MGSNHPFPTKKNYCVENSTLFATGNIECGTRYKFDVIAEDEQGNEMPNFIRVKSPPCQELREPQLPRFVKRTQKITASCALGEIEADVEITDPEGGDLEVLIGGVGPKGVTVAMVRQPTPANPTGIA